MKYKKIIYADYAAATPLDSAVLAAMQPFFVDEFFNPSAPYLAARSVRHKVESARAEIAKTLGTRPREILFTAGATEANNLAVHGIMQQYPNAKVLVSAIEHDSVLEPAKKYNYAIIPVNKNGHIDLNRLEDMIDDTTVLISVMHANNEVGTVQHLSEVGDMLMAVRQERRARGVELPLYFHSDAAQALNYLTVFPHRSGVDLLSLNGGKIYGPKQSGILFVGSGTKLASLIQGGGQEEGLRSGTENVAAIIGLATAVVQAVALREQESKRLGELRSIFSQSLTSRAPGVQQTVQTDFCLPNIVSLLVPGKDNERFMMELDERGVQCGVGSACSASNDEPSHVLKALGLSDEQSQTSLRFSFGRQTTKEDVLTIVGHLAELICG